MTDTQTPITILLCDDEPHITYIVQAKFEQAGYQVIVERNGQEGLDAACEHRPSLVVTDFNMPVMDGLAFSQALRTNPDTADTPVLMLTARGYAIADDELAKTNIVHMESKPFSARGLLKRVQEILDDSARAA